MFLNKSQRFLFFLLKKQVCFYITDLLFHDYRSNFFFFK
ncbi:hypothetical protein BAT_1170 [Bacillus pumilus ATCC 7061]|nr:hypothetical protein BAT_1170 [Bacillus pumilus ATCC 7061]